MPGWSGWRVRSRNFAETEHMEQSGARIHIRGLVQGVGFRPFVFGLAQRLELRGWVRNTSAGVEIEAAGTPDGLSEFARLLQKDAPPLARIDTFHLQPIPAQQFDGFEIVHSNGQADDFLPVLPDASICPDCLRELSDLTDRRYRYPFINCTNCGPRFTIVRDIPYDRPLTTMASFPMCSECAAEYADPANRRFHAQPVACPKCGPQVWFEDTTENRLADGDDAIRNVLHKLRQGQIVAVKGLGGFHLACDATNPVAVAELRRRKLRVDKPFAVMFASADSIREHCAVSPLEMRLIESHQRPIVIVRRSQGSSICAEVSPGQNTIGVMLPYTPLHVLLFVSPDEAYSHNGIPPDDHRLDDNWTRDTALSEIGFPLVMTSGNLSDEPICTDNDQARRTLSNLADCFLFHNRDIHTRCDDSVTRVFPLLRREMGAGRQSLRYPIRRARGYAPDPLILPFDTPEILATGPELKNTFCLVRAPYAFLSHHIGDLENYETLDAFEKGIEHYQRLFRVKPVVLACDQHPDYLATRYAQERACAENLPLVEVQHHHAHIAACMADNSLDGSQPVIGVALDGTGYGDDGAIWGGEFLVADYRGYRRAAHLRYTRLPGGDRAVREPWRVALSWLQSAGLAWDDDLPPVQYGREHSLQFPTGNAGRADYPILELIRRQVDSGVNAPWTSSMGRLFDAAAAIAGVRQEVNYEAQAAIEFEALVDGREPGFYPHERQGDEIDPSPLLLALVADRRAGVRLPVIAARFHAGVARMVLDTCTWLRSETGLRGVALSGGVWQNMFLLTLAVGLLQENGFVVYLHRQAPANDGGIALGQAAVAAFRT